MGDVPASTPQSDAHEQGPKKRGFRFVGSTICYAFMQATGMVNDHAVDCFRYSARSPRASSRTPNEQSALTGQRTPRTRRFKRQRGPGISQPTGLASSQTSDSRSRPPPQPDARLSVIATLALAIGAGVATFAIAEAALITPPPFPEPDRLAMRLHDAHRADARNGAIPLVVSALPHARAVTHRPTVAVGSYGPASINLAGADGRRAHSRRGRRRRLFRRVRRPGRARPSLLGARKTCRPPASPVALIGHDLWRGATAATRRHRPGRSRERHRLTVIGIMPRRVHRASPDAPSCWFPAVLAPRLTYPEYLTTNQDFISVVARLRPGASIASLRAELDAVGATIQRALPSESEVPGDSIRRDGRRR